MSTAVTAARPRLGTWSPGPVVAAVVAGAVGALLVADPAVLSAAGSATAADLVRWAQWAVLGIAPVAAAPVLAGRITALPLGWLVALHLWAVTTSVFADEPGLALLRSLGLVSVSMLGVFLVERFGWSTVAGAVIAALWWTLVGGAVAVVAFDVPARVGGRLQLLTSEYNQLGRLAALAVVASVVLLTRPATFVRALGAASLLTGAAVIALSGSRTSMAAAVVGLVVAAVRRLGAIALVALVVAGAATLAVAAATGVDDRVVDVAAREDDLEDLRTATGRTQIWSAMLEVWLDDPITGHGTGADPELALAESQDGRIGFIARNSQNVLLHELVEHGVVGAFLLVGAVLGYARRTLRRPNPTRDALLSALLIGGFTEAVLERPDVSLLVLAACLADARPARFRGPRRWAGGRDPGPWVF